MMTIALGVVAFGLACVLADWAGKRWARNRDHESAIPHHEAWTAQRALEERSREAKEHRRRQRAHAEQVVAEHFPALPPDVKEKEIANLLRRGLR